MYRVRFHGRGGQGMKTAGRILGTTLFLEGFEVQDAPRYGAERRGAPVFSSVRASRGPIHERGTVRRPDLVVVADDTLFAVAAAGVLAGVGTETVLLVDSDEPASHWQTAVRWPGPVFILREEAATEGDSTFVGSGCAAAAARLLGGLRLESVEEAVRREVAPFGAPAVEANLAWAREAWERFAPHEGRVREGPEQEEGVGEASSPEPVWIEIPSDAVPLSAPDIQGGPTSVEVRTGLWRAMRPVVEAERCRHCNWICGTFCPDGAISAGDSGVPEIDYDHCKGCLVCVAVCPTHAIVAVPERGESQGDAAGGTS